MFDTSLSALVAAGGNSRAARSMRARLQWRDRFGRWIEMGRGVKFKVRGSDGATRSVIGSFVGAKDAQTGQVYVSRDPNGLPDGFYDVNSANAQEFVANLSETQLAERGIQIGRNADGQAVGERMAENIPNLNQMTVKSAPEGWIAQKGTFGGKKVIETDDGDFRVHFGGKDDTVLLEDHRANPGQAQPQRSVAEAFKKVGDVDIQREEGGDTAYTGLAEGNDAKLASLDRDAKVEQIKFNERTIMNEKAGLTAKQQATTNNETLKKELADAGTPYDPENGDTDEALAARKAAPATDTANTPTASTGDIDLSTFEVAPEGFLVPTGKQSNDITPEGLANFMTAEKEQLSKGGSRLVIDTDNNTAEIYNSADTLDDAKAQAGGLGQDTVIDLATGQPVKLADDAVDPNSPDVNPNLDGDTSADAPSGGAPNAEDRNSDAVEPGGAGTGADAPASPEPDAEAGRSDISATDGGDTQPSPDTSSPDGAERPADNAGDSTSAPASTPGSVEELQARRAKIQAALDNTGDPKDIIALNEQADALDTRIASEEFRVPQTRPKEATYGDGIEPIRGQRDEAGPEVPDTPEDVEARLTGLANQIRDLQKQEQDAQGRLNASTSQEEDDAAQADIDRLFDQVAELEAEFEELNARQNSPAEAEAPEEPELDPSAWAENKLAPSKDEIKNAPAGSLIAEEHNESGDQRIYRKTEDGKWEQLKRDGSGEPSGYVTRGETFHTQGSRSHYATDEAGTRPESPEAARRREEQLQRIEAPEPVAEPAPERPEYQEPGDVDAVAKARAEIAEIDAEIETQLNAAEAATDPQTQAEHLSRVRTLERQRKIQDNALNRALGNAPMDLNGELGWNMNKPENRGSLPEAPEAPENAPELPGLPEETVDAPEPPESDAPAVLDPELETPEVDFNEVLRKKLQNEPLTPAEQREFDAMQAAEAADKARPIEERVAEAQAAYDAAEKNLRDMLLADEFDDDEVDKAETLMDWAKQDLDEALLEQSYENAERQERAEIAADEAEFGPETPGQVAERILADVAETSEILDGITLADGKGGAFEQKDDPDRVSSGHTNGIEAAKAKMQGKDFTPEEQQAISEALNSESLSDNQLAELHRTIDAAPNKANTTTVARPTTEQPEFLSTADVDIVNAEREDPNFVFDEDLTWRKVREEFPNAVELENGDLILETTTKTTGKSGTKKYDLVMRRTSKNRFMTYILETDEGGNRRAKRVGGSEWHSYEALEKKSIQRGRKLINGARPSSYFANSKENPTENLGTQGFPEDDFLGDIGNPNAPIPATGDERYDHLLEVVATHIRNGDADIDDIEAHLQRIDPGSGAISTIMNAVIGRAQDNYRPDGVAPWQSYDGETVEIGAEYDWTDWHQEKDWWLPNGELNKNRRPNRNYGKVERVRVTGYVKENTDGKGHTYGDHVWVQIQKPDGSWSNWTKRSAQTLRPAEPGSDTGLPFFSKREEWRASPEALARRFRVPNASPEEPVVTKERPRRDLPASRRLRFTPRGSLSGYSNVPVPKDQPTIAGMIQRQEVRPQIRPARDARPGMMIVRMDDDGNQFVDSIIRVENLGDGGYRIHAARPDGRGFANVDSFVVPEDADIPLWTAPGIAAPETPEPKNLRRGETVEFDRNGQVETGVIAFDDDNGNLTVVAPGNETIDILESNIRPASYQDITKEERSDVIESLDSTDMPQLIRDLVMRGILDPGLSRLRYEQLLDTVRAFTSKSPRIIEIDELLDMMGATDQDRADVRDYLDTDPTN
ncbi:hypothetical protein SEA_ZOOMAN_70 [Microbacterium phage Zooman]|nr:hypothetical protein SEA_ZOOMAN_70 [Microbacterium phage Zooman]